MQLNINKYIYIKQIKCELYTCFQIQIKYLYYMYQEKKNAKNIYLDDDSWSIFSSSIFVYFCPKL